MRKTTISCDACGSVRGENDRAKWGQISMSASLADFGGSHMIDDRGFDFCYDCMDTAEEWWKRAGELFTFNLPQTGLTSEELREIDPINPAFAEAVAKIPESEPSFIEDINGNDDPDVNGELYGNGGSDIENEEDIDWEGMLGRFIDELEEQHQADQIMDLFVLYDSEGPPAIPAGYVTRMEEAMLDRIRKLPKPKGPILAWDEAIHRPALDHIAKHLKFTNNQTNLDFHWERFVRMCSMVEVSKDDELALIKIYERKKGLLGKAK